MKGDENIVRVETLDDFDRELARDGGETLEVPASLAEEYGLFSEDVGSEDEIRDAGRGSARPRGGRAMKHDEYHRQFADAIIEQIRQGTALVAEALGAGRARAPRERRYEPLLQGREQPASRRRAAGARLRRRALGHLPPDPSPGRTGAQGRAGHSHPLVPGPPEDRRQRRARTAQEGQRRQARLPPRAPAHARRPPVHRVQRRAGRRAPGPARARCRAALEGAPAGRTRPRGQRGPRPSRGGGPGVLQPEPRRDRAPGEGTVPLGQPLLPDRATRAGAQHRPPGAHEPRDAHPRDL